MEFEYNIHYCVTEGALMSLSILSVMASFGLPKCTASRCKKSFAAFTLRSIFPKNVQTVAICIDRRSRPMPSPRIRKTASRCDLSFKRERFRQMLFVKCRRKRVTQSRSAREVTLKSSCAKESSTPPTLKAKRWHAPDGLSDDFARVAKPLQAWCVCRDSRYA